MSSVTLVELNGGTRSRLVTVHCGRRATFGSMMMMKMMKIQTFPMRKMIIMLMMYIENISDIKSFCSLALVHVSLCFLIL